MKEDYVCYPAECCEQVDERNDKLAMSPLYEDKTQMEEFYKDVRFPSTLQSRAPSVASSLRSEPTSAALSVRTRGGGRTHVVFCSVRA